MGFERRRHPKDEVPHECQPPRSPFLPWLFWPRWHEGARWRCGRCVVRPEQHGRRPCVYSGGCGVVWEWQREGGYDPYFNWMKIG